MKMPHISQISDKHKCVDVFVLVLLILCLKAKAQLTLPIFFQNNFKKNDDDILNHFENRY